MSKRSVTAFAMAAALTAVACSSSRTVEDGAASEPDTATTVVEAGDDVSSGSDSQAALGRVRLGGDPEVLEGGSLTIRTEAGTAIDTPVYLDVDGGYYVVPFHPDAPMEGGAVSVSAPDGSVFEVVIEALPPADGAAQDAVDRLTVGVDAMAASFGSSFDELLATEVEQVPDALLTLKLAQVILDDGAGGGLAPSVGDEGPLDAEQRELLDAVIGATDFGSAVGPLTAVIPPTQETTPADPEGGEATPTTTTGHRGGAAAQEIAPVHRQAGCLANTLVIDTKEQLSSEMQAGVDDLTIPGGPLDQLVQDLSAILTLAGTIPTVGVVFDVGGVVLALVGALRGFGAGVYPTNLDSLDADVLDAEFVEDFTVPGAWQNVIVVASSTGYQATADLANITLQLVSIGVGEAVGRTLGDRLLIDGEIIATATRSVVVAGVIAWISERIEAISICPQTWRVDVTGEDYSQGSIENAAFSFDNDTESFEPIDVQDARIDATLLIRANPDRFSGRTVSREFDTSVRPIQVALSQSIVDVSEPGDVIELDLEIAGAQTETVLWSPEAGTWEDGLGEETTGSVTRTMSTPARADDFPYDVTVDANSVTGLRVDLDPPRTDSVTIRLLPFIVDPDGTSVLIGDAQQFTATNRDGTAADVRWEATGGSISSTGVYTAGDDVGDFTVTAISLVDPAIRVTVVVKVVDVSCHVGIWRIREADLLAQIEAKTRELGQPVEFVYLGGEYIITLNEDGTFASQRLGLQWSLETPGSPGLLILQIDAMESGTWSLDDEQTTIDIVETAGEATVAIDVEVGGRRLPSPLGSDSVPSSSGFGTGAVDCQGDEMTVTFDGITSNLDRLEQIGFRSPGS